MKCGTAVEENVGDKKRSVKMKRAQEGFLRLQKDMESILIPHTFFWQQGLMGIFLFLCLMKGGAFDHTSCIQLPLWFIFTLYVQQ